MRILVLEDEKIQRDNLVKVIERQYIDIKTYSVGTIKEAKEIAENKDIDMFFIDINLPDGSGLEFAKEIRTIERYEHSGMVFITTQIIQIIEAFKSTHCYDVLIKPFNEDDIKKIVDTFYKKSNKPNSVDKGNFFIVPIDSGISIKIYEEEIIFVEHIKRKSVIHTLQGKIECKNLTLSSILDKCINGNVLRAHKSYLVNIKYIKSIEKVYAKLSRVYFFNTEEIAELSNSYKDTVYEKWSNNNADNNNIRNSNDYNI